MVRVLPSVHLLRSIFCDPRRFFSTVTLRSVPHRIVLLSHACWHAYASHYPSRTRAPQLFDDDAGFHLVPSVYHPSSRHPSLSSCHAFLFMAWILVYVFHRCPWVPSWSPWVLSFHVHPLSCTRCACFVDPIRFLATCFRPHAVRESMAKRKEGRKEDADVLLSTWMKERLTRRMDGGDGGDTRANADETKHKWDGRDRTKD